MTSFQDILNTPFSEIKPPKPLPPGEYLAMIEGQPEITTRGKNQTPCVIFQVKLLQAVNQDPIFQRSVADALETKTLSDIKLSHTMWVTPESKYRLKAFLEDHLAIEGATNATQAIPMAQGRQLIVTLGHYVTNREGEAPRVGMDIKGTARAQ